MKTSFFVSLTLFSLASLPALGADRVGNGGFAYVCRDQAGKITQAQLLDLWEAEELRTWRKDDAVEAQISAALAKLAAVSPNAKSFLAQNLARLRKSTIFVNRPLTRTEDAFPPYQPGPGCAYEQVARYEPVLTQTGTRGLRIYREIFDSPLFSNSDRAALFIHEAAYLMDRAYNDATNSQRTRMIVAHLFSDSPLPTAVRLTVAALLGVKAQGEEQEKAFLSVDNPLQIPVQLYFTQVDGANDGYGKLTEAQKANLYRCTLLTFNQGHYYDTGWISLKDLLGDVYSGGGPRPTLLKALLVADEFEGDGPAEGNAISNSVIARCESKSPAGETTTVKFEARVNFESDVECLGIGDDGSITTGRGDRCEITLQSSLMPGVKGIWADQTVEFVRSGRK